MSDTELKKCPFCGGEALRVKRKREFPHIYSIMCVNCHCRTSFEKSEDEAITFWNTRKPMERIVEQLEEGGSMERLTTTGTKEANESITIREMINKLAEYEDLEEQGLLLRLPCKVGDTVYRICPKCDNDHDGSCKNCAWEGTAGMKGCTVYGLWRDGQYPPDKCTIVPYKVTWNYVPNLLHNIGKTVFLTSEEAEAALHVQGGITVKQDNYIKNN